MSGSGGTLTATSSPDIKDFKIRKTNPRGYSAKNRSLAGNIKVKPCKTRSNRSSKNSSKASSKSSNKSKKAKKKLITEIWTLAF